MRNFLLAAVAAVALFGAGLGGVLGQSFNDDPSRWMMLKNESPFRANRIYMIPSRNGCCWSRDLLEDIFIERDRGKSSEKEPEDPQAVNFDDGSGTCEVDIRITTEIVGWDWFLAKVNVCNDAAREIVLGGKKLGQPRRLKVKNDSKLTAIKVYAIPTYPADCCWSHDLLGKEVIRAGDTLEVDFDDGTKCQPDTPHKVDIRVTSNRRGIDWYFDGVDVCSKQATDSGLTLKGDGKNRWLTVKNETKHLAYSASIIPTGADCCWSHDLLGARVIAGGEALEVDFDDGSGGCTFDIKITRRERGPDWLFDKVDVCTQSELTLKAP